MSNLAQMVPAVIPLAELQKAFALIRMGNDVRICDRQEIAELRAGIGIGSVNMYPLQPAKLLMKRYLETLPVYCDAKQVIEEHLKSPSTVMYTGFAFSPLPVPPTILNFWIAPPLQPVAGDFSVIRNFLRDIVCAGNDIVFGYLILYIAHMLQNPEEKPGVMLAMLGGHGTGKGTFFELLRSIWKFTTLMVSDVDHIIGHFNADLERNFVVCLDEALFSGDRKAMDRMKSMITEPTVTIEQKHQPRRSIHSYHRFIASSNHSKFGNIEEDDRRFVFLRVSEARKGDHEYWHQVHAAIDDDIVIAAFMHYLLELDLSKFNVRDRPKTTEHMEQKIRSLSGFKRYWFEVLQSGAFPAVSDFGGALHWNEPIFVNTETLMQGWKFHERAGKQYETRQTRELHQAIAQLCRLAKSGRRQTNGD